MGLYIKYNQSAVTGLIALNVAIFVACRIVGNIWSWVECPAGIANMVSRPWTMLTYMFVHREFIHLLFNMIWLWAFGDIFMTLGTRRQLCTTYLAGGFCGALTFAVWSAISGATGYLDGASAAVIAVVVASAWRTPNMPLRLVLIGEVKVKWIAVAMVVMSLFNGIDGSVLSAHIGGLVWGLVWGAWMTNSHRRFSLFTHPRHSKSNELIDLDSILDKIRRSGYNSLNAAERKALLKHSKRL